jgi:hypothetical protein
VTRAELEALIDQVRRRHNRRIVALFGLFMMLTTLGMLSMPRSLSKPQREVWLLAVVALDAVLAISGMAWALGAAKADCYRLDVLCPVCRRHLYSRRPLLFGGPGTRETGLCPHCGAHLIDGLGTNRVSSP